MSPTYEFGKYMENLCFVIHRTEVIDSVLAIGKHLRFSFLTSCTSKVLVSDQNMSLNIH